MTPTGEGRSGDVRVDRERCMGSGNCVYWAPHVFDIDDGGFAVVHGDPEAHAEEVTLAAQGCPTQAIHVG